MSTFKKNTLALAVVATLGFAANAAAYDLGTGNVPAGIGDDNPIVIGTPDAIMPFTVDAPPAPYVGEQVHVSILPTDPILGRTTGFAVRLRLSAGHWEVAPTVMLNATMAATWTTSVATGVGTNEIIVSVSPSAGFPAGVPVGNLFTLTNVQIDGADALAVLQSDFGTITLSSTMFDPVTTVNILDNPSTPLIRAREPRIIACSTAGRADPNEKIDVGIIANPPAAGQGSKVAFSSDGSVGTIGNFTTRNYQFNPGFITYNVNGAVPSFQYLVTDVFRTRITLNNYSDLGRFATGAGGSIFLATDNTCATPVALVALNSVIGNTITMTYTITAPPLLAAGGFTTALCMNVSATNTVTVLPTTITAETWHRRAGGSFPTNSPSGPCSLAPLVYNGSIVKVETFNHAANTVATGLLRITNPSTQTGLVTIDAWDDAGVKRGPVTFTLAAGASAQYNSSHLETGTALAPNPALTGSLGTPTVGRWRFLVTGEFSGMRVVSFARNNADNTLENMTDYDTNNEQVSSTALGIPLYEGQDPN